MLSEILSNAKGNAKQCIVMLRESRSELSDHKSKRLEKEEKAEAEVTKIMAFTGS